MHLEGIFTALVTPFDNDMAVEEYALRRLIEKQIACEVDGVVLCGSTGEAPTLTDKEKIQIIRASIDQAYGRFKIIAGGSSNCTKSACEWHEKLSRLDIHAAMHTVPWYNKPTQDGIFRHFDAIAQVSRVPIILYNIPGRTGVNMAPETLIALATKHSHIIALKESNVDGAHLEKLFSLREQNRVNLSILSGEDGFMLDLLQMGGQGNIAVASHIVAPLMVDLYTDFKSNNLEKARKLDLQLKQIANLIFSYSNPIPIKTALAHYGYIRPHLRLPLCELEPHTRTQWLTQLAQVHDPLQMEKAI